jgi:hypothetical protein
MFRAYNFTISLFRPHFAAPRKLFAQAFDFHSLSLLACFATGLFSCSRLRAHP